MPRNIVFAIDVEPNARKLGPSGSWDGTAVTLREVSALRNRLHEATGAPVRLNWFPRFDPQIQRTWGRRDWVVEACPTLLPTAVGNGDLIGIHVHLWRWHETRAVWFADFADDAWRADCFGASIEGYRSLLGARPIASRFGDRSLFHRDIALLRRSGIRYDLTLEPGAPSHRLSIDALASCHLPDYRRAPRCPYRPSRGDYLVPREPTSAVERSDDKPSGDEPSDDLWLVPMTVTRRSYWVPLRQPPFLIKSALPLNLVMRPRRAWAHLAGEMDRESPAPIVCALRSGDLANPSLLANFHFITRRMIRHPRMSQCRFVSVDCAVEAFAGSPNQAIKAIKFIAAGQQKRPAGST